MTCEEVEAALAQGSTSAGRDDALRHHLLLCPDCAALAPDDLLAAAAAAVLRAERTPPLPRLEGRLLAAFRAHAAARGPRPRPAAWIRLAIAATIVATAWPAAWWLTRQTPTPRPAPAPRAAAPSDAIVRSGAVPPTPHPSRRPSTGVAATAAAVVVPNAPPSRAGTRPLPAAASASSVAAPAAAPQDERIAEAAADEDMYEEFVPLWFAALPAGDTGHVVSVELPRSALYDYGVAAAPMPTDPVRADVLVSDDGLPRAVRFVEPLPAASVNTRPLQGQVPRSFKR